MFENLFDEWWQHTGEALYTARMRQDCEDIWDEACRALMGALVDSVVALRKAAEEES